jgi:tRNA A-37 threonylcarbamoyl transferase component Bud32
LTSEYLIRIPNNKRVEDVIKEFKNYDIWEIEKENIIRFKRENKIFKQVNQKESFLKNGLLYMERIDSVALSTYIQEKEIFLVLLKKSILQLQEYKKKYGFSHGDFHIDNILVDQNNIIYFIDFEYRYKENFYRIEIYADIIILLNLLLIKYPHEYLLYKRDILHIIQAMDKKNDFIDTLKKMKNYLKENYYPIKDFFENC